MEYAQIAFWSPAQKGYSHDQFCQQAAKIISTMPANALFGSSRVNAGGHLDSGEPPFKDGKGILHSRADSSKPPAEVENNKIVNLYLPNGQVNVEVLSTCLTKLEETPYVSYDNPHAKTLAGKFKLSTGRNQLLDFMAQKSQEARKQIENDVFEARKKRSFKRLLRDIPENIRHLYLKEYARQETMAEIKTCIYQLKTTAPA